MKTKMMSVAMLVLLAGCFTWHEAVVPESVFTRAPKGKDVKINLTGFAATLTQYVSVWGHETVYVDDGWHMHRGGRHRGFGGGHYSTVTTETLVPQTSANDAFFRRAQAILEDNGYILRAQNPDWIVDVVFEGPYKSDSEAAVEFAWMFCSVLSAEYAVQTWSAKLKIYDARSGHVVHSRDFQQKYDVAMWSPLFFVGLSGTAKTTFTYLQSHCLQALTDSAVAEATAFLASR